MTSERKKPEVEIAIFAMPSERIVLEEDLIKVVKAKAESKGLNLAAAVEMGLYLFLERP
jgi:hypothetical protein